MFQSSPSPKAGRCPIIAGMSDDDRLFQSSPSPKAGRCVVGGVAGGGRAIVSILAQPEGWALPASASIGSRPITAFQSSPSPKAGRCSSKLTTAPSTHCLFQSSPSPKAGRCRSGPRPRRRRTRRFNPRPARRLGAALRRASLTASDASFQSSPSPKAGRCVEEGVSDSLGRVVSILAQPEGWALLELFVGV